MGNKGSLTALLTNNADQWAEWQNAGGKVNFNVVKSPYDVWNGKYTAIRPRGATFEHPEGIDAAYAKARQPILGLLDLIVKK
jgi:hypothetical protein